VSGQLAVGKSRSYDLAELAAALAKAERSIVWEGWLGIGLGVFLVVVGVYFGVVGQSPDSISQIVEGGVIAAAGIGVALASRAMMSSASKYPSKFEFTQHGFRLGQDEPGSWLDYQWSDPKFLLTMFDRTGVPAPARGGSAYPTFTILLWKGRKAAVPREVFELVLRGARGRGLRVSRLDYGSRMKRWGHVLVFTVRP
jgi:hypothetical protein